MAAMDSSLASWMKPQVFTRMWVASPTSSTTSRPRVCEGTPDRPAIGLVLGAPERVDVYPGSAGRARTHATGLAG